MSRRFETLVVGAGISGLAYAHARGTAADLVVLEVSGRAGGLVGTEHAGVRRYELGPEALLRDARGELSELCAELGVELGEPPAGARRRYLVHRGRLVEAPLGPRELSTTPLLGARAKMRVLAEPLRDPRRALDGSIADFARHRLGDEALAALVEPLVAGIHAGDPEVLSMRACFPQLVELVERHGSLFRGFAATRGESAPGIAQPTGGCQELTDALARALGSRLELGVRVDVLAHDGARFHAETSAGPLEAERLVLAVPAAEAARLVAPFAPDLARPIRTLAAESLVSLVHVRRREDVRHPLDGFGYLVPAREGLAHLGTLFSSSIAPGSAPEDEVVLRTLLGGARRPEMVRLDDERLLALVEREVGPLLGLASAPLAVAIRRWPAVIPRYDLAHPARLAAIERATPPGLALLGNWLGGIGVNHLVAAARALASSHAPAARP